MNWNKMRFKNNTRNDESNRNIIITILCCKIISFVWQRNAKMRKFLVRGFSLVIMLSSYDLSHTIMYT